MKTTLAKSAFWILRLLGLVREIHESGDSCFVEMARYYDALSPWQKEILFRIVRNAHPGVSVIRFRMGEREEFRCLSDS